MNRSRDDIPRRQIALWVVARHERRAVGVDQSRALSSQRLGGEWRGIGCDIEGRGMELHELRIRNYRAGIECLG